MNITVVLTRYPLREFHWGQMSGRWGQMVLFKGPSVSAAVVLSTAAPPPRSPGHQMIRLGNERFLHLSTSGEVVEDVRQYTTMERFRANSGNGYYVRLRPRTAPYAVTFEPRNPVVAGLRPGHDGRCFRIHGAETWKEQAILIHEAPNVSWLLGCISPRPLDNYGTSFSNDPSNPSSRSIEEMIEYIGKERATFYVD